MIEFLAWLAALGIVYIVAVVGWAAMRRPGSGGGEWRGGGFGRGPDPEPRRPAPEGGPEGELFVPFEWLQAEARRVHEANRLAAKS